jgi:hypothetical protein
MIDLTPQEMAARPSALWRPIVRLIDALARVLVAMTAAASAPQAGRTRGTRRR